MRNDFMQQFAACFDENDTVKLCGRDACKSLILLCRKLDGSRKYGDMESGFLNVEEVIALRDQLVNTEDT